MGTSAYMDRVSSLRNRKPSRARSTVPGSDAWVADNEKVFLLLGSEAFREPLWKSPIGGTGSNEENLAGGKAMRWSSKRFVVTYYANLRRPFNPKRSLDGRASLKCQTEHQNWRPVSQRSGAGFEEQLISLLRQPSATQEVHA